MGRSPKEPARALATALAGGNVQHLGYGSLRAVLAKPSSTQLAVAFNGDCLFVVAIDLPGRSLRWGDLVDQHAEVPLSRACMVGTYPASAGFEFELRDQDVQRHLSMAGGVVEIDEGPRLGFEQAVSYTQTLAVEEKWDDYDHVRDMSLSALAALLGLTYDDPPRELRVHRFGAVTDGASADGSSERDQTFPPMDRPVRADPAVREPSSSRMRLDASVDAAYFSIQPVSAAGEAVEQVILQRRGGQVILDFSSDGHLLGVEVLGAHQLLSDATIRSAEPLDDRAAEPTNQLAIHPHRVPALSARRSTGQAPRLKRTRPPVA